MDFGWALRAMRNGEAVRRLAWDRLRDIPEEYARLRIESPPGWGEMLVVESYDGLKRPYNGSHSQLLATDWELA